ncbi:MAG: protease SohB [Gammaproteobacteria bacterium]|nr:protease SohB [Gammaproteobacteria bacterium]
MLELFAEYGLFLAKTVTVLVAVLVVIGSALSSSGKNRNGKKSQIKTEFLNDHYKEMKHVLQGEILTKDELKQLGKAEKKSLKEEKKKNKNKTVGSRKRRVYVLDFNGDVKASEVDHLREEITAVLSMAEKQDEVVVNLESPGGMVHSYGLASSQLARIRSSDIPLTICVDKVAASGGYMMACLGNKIVAAPFAILGSIGVLAQIPNFSRLLKKNDIDYELYTAGEYKRTVTMFGENTDKGREKFKEEIEDTHDLFKDFVSTNRPNMDMAKVATGEHWYGLRAKELGLLDEIMTSDEYITEACKAADVYAVSYEEKKNMATRLGFSVEEGIDRLVLRWVSRVVYKRF